jgi:hypothetical protein
MPSHFETPIFTRRGVLTLAASAGFAGFSRLYAANPDFWNKKDPSDWSRDEIDQLTSKSPWAKEVTANIPEPRGDYGGQNGGGPNSGQGGPGGSPGGVWGGGPRIGGIPGMGIPGIGGGGMGGGRRGGGQQPVQTYRGTVRWESAKPIMEALKTPLPDAFADRYVISVSGIPLPNSRRGSRDDDDNDSNSDSTRDILDRLKSLSSLEPKGKVEAQAGVVQQQSTAGLGSILFGFSKDILSLKPEDKEVTFSTQFGRVEIRTKFNLKEMMYRGDLAL